MQGFFLLLVFLIRVRSLLSCRSLFLSIVVRYYCSYDLFSFLLFIKKQLNDPSLKDFLQSPKVSFFFEQMERLSGKKTKEISNGPINEQCLSYFLNLFDFLSQETLRLSYRLPPLEVLFFFLRSRLIPFP